MTPEPQKRFRGLLFFISFWRAKRALLQGVLQILACRTWFYCVVNRGGFVVKTWLETAANSMAKIFQLFKIYFWPDEAGEGMGIAREADFSAALLTMMPRAASVEMTVVW
jgi:hypothetical protein